ncbi:MAG: hypothetical protein FWC49_00375 [Proteobacteria bacterium]|nr:hypothetical protein [Pseudomonadota bacterium]
MPLARSASLAVFVLGLAAIFSWAWWQLGLFEQSEPGPKCGMPVLAIYGMAIVGSGLTSLLAALLNAPSLVRLPKPRPALRILELAVLAAPAILTALFIGLLLSVG